MKILVTGAGGFIGSHVALRLAKEGHQIIGFDNGFTATHNQINKVKMIKGDVTNFKEVEKAGKNCQVIVHLAGLLGTNEIAQYGQIPLANLVNINGTVNVLDLCRKNKAKHIFATKPNPQEWMNPYTITKQSAENYCQMYSNEYKVQTIALSLFWVYGKEQRQEPVNKFIPTFMKYALEKKPVPIWNDGKNIIDCCYIDDIVEAFTKAVKYKIKEKFLKIDVGTGIPVTIEEVAGLVNKLTGNKAGFKYIGKRLGEPYGSALIADTSFGKRYLKFVPSITLETGLKLCLPWFKEKFQK